MNVHYLEIVTEDVDGICAMYEEMHGVSFGQKEAELGHARVAKLPNGNLVGVRAPLADHETPITRAYVAVDDIEVATKRAAERGAVVAYPPTKQGTWGTFAIVIHAGVQHGLWQL